jgi:hypothetical protein
VGPEFPPRDFDVHPLAGWQMRHGELACLVIGFEVLRDGRFRVPGFTVRYHIGGRHFAAHYRHAVEICSPTTRYSHC